MLSPLLIPDDSGVTKMKLLDRQSVLIVEESIVEHIVVGKPCIAVARIVELRGPHVLALHLETAGTFFAAGGRTSPVPLDGHLFAEEPTPAWYVQVHRTYINKLRFYN